MVTLPNTLTTTKYPGYFWDVDEHELYSIKVHGELRALKITRPGKYNKLDTPVYRVSVRGVRKVLALPYLTRLTLKDSEIEKT